MATEPTQDGTEAGWNNSFLILGTNMWFGTNNSRVYHSTDLGLSWSFGVTTGPPLGTFAVHYNNLSDGLAGGGSPSPSVIRMQKSNDGGATYTATNVPGTTGIILGIEGNGTDWWAVRSDANIYMSTDQGATPWTTVHTQAGAVFQDIDFSTVSGCANGWAVGDGGSIARMTGDIPTPVELSSFTSSAINNNVTLNWTTVSEENNSGFEIERSMVNSQWSKIGFVQGSGTITTQKNYTFTDRNVNSGRYNYRLKQIDYNGNFEYYNLSNEVIVGVPEKFSLKQNYPNPFNPKTVISYQLAVSSIASLKVYDVLGNEVATLINEKQNAGYYTINFEGNNFSSGVYFYKLLVDGNIIDIKRMLLLK